MITTAKEQYVYPMPYLSVVIKILQRLNGEDPQRKMKDITESIMNKEVSFTLEGYFLLDCRRLASKGLTGLLNQLRTTCQTLRETADIDLHCNILKAICVEEFDDETVACKFSDIVDMIKSDSYYHKSHLGSFCCSQHSVIKVTYYYFKITLM